MTNAGLPTIAAKLPQSTHETGGGCRRISVGTSITNASQARYRSSISSWGIVGKLVMMIEQCRRPSPKFRPELSLGLLTFAMAKRRKNRTHLKGGIASSGAATVDPSVPKSFVIRHGPVGGSLTQLVRDMRRLMEPHTASRLKVSIGMILF